jgi:hypothetical protein
VGDRLLFIHSDKKLSIQGKADKESYKPYEQVNMQFAISEKDTIPVETTFSVSIKDGQNDIKPDQDIQSNLLLMSEIKGYVHHPDYYFESNDPIHQQALDLLLMVQGWHRYSWAWVDGNKPFELKHQLEKGIEINGQVVSFVKSTPKPKVNVSTLLSQKNDSTKLNNSFMECFVTDSLGRFSFTADVEGRWDMVFAVTEKGKKKDHRTVLDKLFSPEPRRYCYTDLFANIPDPEENKTNREDTLTLHSAKDTAIVSKINYTPNGKKGLQGKVLSLKEVVVKAKKGSKEEDILENRTKSMAYYDVYAELDKARDENNIADTYLNDFLIRTNKDFRMASESNEAARLSGEADYLGGLLMYKTGEVLFVVDYKRTTLDQNRIIPLYIRMNYIKSIYISESSGAILDYFILPPSWSPDAALAKFSCVVFIEIFPDWKMPVEAGKGVRKTWLDGYSKVKEFYSPNYSRLPVEQDYRRTLYWNPAVPTDKEGKALIQFYNNSSCRNFSVSVETITPQGVIGVLKK